MANKSHTTRQKLSFRAPTVAPRNPTVAPMHKRKAGAHQSSKAREQEKLDLKKALLEVELPKPDKPLASR